MIALPMSVVLPMQEEDLDEVAACEARATAFAWSRQHFADSLAAGYACWLMRRDGELVGQAVVMNVLDEAHLLIISVAPEWRRRGFARQLLAHLRSHAREVGVAQLFLEVRASNEAAIALYRTCGFEEVGRRKSYYPAPGGLREDALVLRCVP